MIVLSVTPSILTSLEIPFLISLPRRRHDKLDRELRRCDSTRASPNLDVGKVDAVEVRQHLVDLGRVLEDGAGRLGQVVQTGVAAQGLGERVG